MSLDSAQGEGGGSVGGIRRGLRFNAGGSRSCVKQRWIPVLSMRRVVVYNGVNFLVCVAMSYINVA